MTPAVAGAHSARLSPLIRGGAAAAPAACVVHSLPSFVQQGENVGQQGENVGGVNTSAMVADVIEVECNPELYKTGQKIVISASQLNSLCAKSLKWWVESPFEGPKSGGKIEVSLDADGNATVAVIGGPGCQTGESFITADETEGPFESFTTTFNSLPPADTPTGVSVLTASPAEPGAPAEQVLNATDGNFLAIVEVEDNTAGENLVHIQSTELFSRCKFAPKLTWIKQNGTESAGPEVTEVKLDNNGNGFVLIAGHESCRAGSSLIEADLEESPFTSWQTRFNLLPPQPTAEPAFTIEKLQEIKGSGAGFTTSPLTGEIGQTVDYEIVVKNTASVAETFSAFTDANCDPGTIAGGPGSSPVASGEPTTYTCDHVLTKVGAYTNEATVTASTVGGTPITHTSNQVVVEVPSKPAFTIVKLQEINSGGLGFTTAQLTGAIGQTVNYRIVVENTGNVPLTFSGFTDANCDSGTIAGGPGSTPVVPGESTTYTCDHVLTKVGMYTNEATVTGTPEGEPSITLTHTSNQVVVEVPPRPAFTIVKLQEINSSSLGFTTAQLTGSIGQAVNYEIIVTNTGNVALTFSGFTDANCDPGTIAGGPGSSSVAPGEPTTYTCDHVLKAEGIYTNDATVTGAPEGEAPITHESNQVVVEVPSMKKARFAIEKLQEIKGSGAGPTPLTLTGAIGQTVDYEIVVKNTGEVPLTFSSLADANCDSGTIAGGSGSTPLAPGESTTYTCDHVLTGTGSYPNVASITGTPEGEAPITHESNRVVVEVPREPKFTIEKLQEIKGSSAGFTRLTLTGAAGQTVDYEIVVTNTGNVALTFSGFSDANCDAGTIAGGPGSSPVGPGESTTYTCDHALTTTGSYTNVAMVTGMFAAEAPFTHTSNQVLVEVPESKAPPVVGTMPVALTNPPPSTPKREVLAECARSAPLQGASGPKRRTFTVQTSSIGIEQITFYLDGRKLETLKQSQARRGKFTVKINPLKLSFGAHKLSAKTLLSDPSCKAPTRSSLFVRPYSARVAPRFTG